MGEKLTILVCAYLENEVRAAIQAEAWSDVEVQVFEANCDASGPLPSLCAALAEGDPSPELSNILVLTGQCSCRDGVDRKIFGGASVFASDDCFELFMDPETVRSLGGHGSHLLLPGMVQDWRHKLEAWGFNQTMARAFFAESTDKLVMIDTGKVPDVRHMLEEFAAYIDRPYEVKPITLHYFRNLLARLVLEWRLRRAGRTDTRQRADAERRLADFALAFDMIARLSSSLDREKVLKDIMELFHMLCSPGAVLIWGRDGPHAICSDPPKARLRPAVERLIAEGVEDYAWTDEGRGFVLPLAYREESLGGIVVVDIGFPEHGDDYVNLALHLRPVIGLALSNAETYSKLQETEQELRHYQSDLEKMVTARTAELTQEVAERKRAEDRLAKWGQIFEHAEWGVVVGSADGKTIELMNPAFAHMHGYERVEELIDQPITSIFAPHDRTALPDQIKKAHVKGHNTFEADHLRKDGSIFPALIDVTAVRGEDGTVLYRVVNVLDITERRAMEQRLRDTIDALSHSNEELERFAYVASHDLQEPVRTLISFSQLLERKYRSQLDQEGEEFLDFIVSAAKRMHTLIHDLLNYSRVESRGQGFTQVSMTEVLETAKSNLDQAIRESGAKLVYEALPNVAGDKLQITELVQNLLANAIKFSRRGVAPKITISAQLKKGRWVIVVADNGIGIKPQFFDRIFTIFQRLHLESDYPGTGIGLAICMRIVERHGGRIWVESKEGKGSTFFFTLPEVGSGAQEQEKFSA